MKFIQNSPQSLISAGFPAASDDLNAVRQVGSTNPGASDVTTPPAVEAYRRGEHTPYIPRLGGTQKGGHIVTLMLHPVEFAVGYFSPKCNVWALHSGENSPCGRLCYVCAVVFVGANLSGRHKASKRQFYSGAPPPPPPQFFRPQNPTPGSLFLRAQKPHGEGSFPRPPPGGEK